MANLLRQKNKRCYNGKFTMSEKNKQWQIYYVRRINGVTMANLLCQKRINGVTMAEVLCQKRINDVTMAELSLRFGLFGVLRRISSISSYNYIVEYAKLRQTNLNNGITIGEYNQHFHNHRNDIEVNSNAKPT